MLHAGSTVESVIARGAPIALAAMLAAWLTWRTPGRARSAVEIMGLALACVAGRLVFESVMIPYYLLATSVVFLLLDLARRELPARSLAWIAATATFVVLPIHSKPVDAVGTLMLTSIALVVGLRDARLIGDRNLGREVGPGTHSTAQVPGAAARPLDAVVPS
jgi:hypothetical protein